MQLQATVARLIDRNAVINPDTVILDGQRQPNDSQMHAGDYYLVPNYIPQEVSRTWLQRQLDRLLKRHIIPPTKLIYTLVISCPFCGLPILTNFAHQIVSQDPLTLDTPVTCPYRSADPKPHTFQIHAGEITIPDNTA